jgi:cytidine diphosphoramidate kinase
MVIWITGISGSGKTTIATKVYEKIKQQKNAIVFLDGDQFRYMMNNDLKYTLADRDTNAIRMTRTCKILSDQGINVICGANLTSQKYRDWCRDNINNYFEVFLDVPMDVLKKRDIKELYKKAFKGEIDNVVGVDIPFINPQNPDLVIDNSKELSDYTNIVDRIIDSSKIFKK